MLSARLVFILLFFIAGSLHQLLYVAFPLLAFLSIYERGFEVPQNPLTKLYLGLLMAICTITLLQYIVNGILPDYTFKGILRYFSYFCLSIFLTSFTPSSWSFFFNTIVKIFALLTPYALVEVMLHDRYVFIFHHANNLAYVLVLLLFFILFYEIKNKWVYALAISLSLLCTKSSGGLVTMLLLYICYFLSLKNLTLVNKLAILSLIISAAVGILFAMPTRAGEQFQSLLAIDWQLIWERAQSQKFGSYGSGVWRMTYWLAILNEFFTNNFAVIITGLGLDSLTLGNYVYGFMTRDPHNDYVKLLVELGILGFLYFFYFAYRLLKVSRFNYLYLLVLLLPMYFGNILVNFPFNILFISLLSYQYQSLTTTTVTLRHA